MQISLRSQLVAGAVAIVGSSAIAIAPLAQPTGQLPGLHSAPVTLASFANPFDALLSSLQLVNNNVFNGNDHYAPYDMLQGILPEQTVANQPVRTQMQMNEYFYLNTLIAGLATGTDSSLKTLGSMIWGLPSALITAAQQVFSGNFSGALATLNNAILVPIQQAAAAAALTAAVIAGGIATNLVSVIQTLPGIVGNLIDTVRDTTQVLVGATTEAVTNVLGALTNLDFEGAWNAWVEGALSPAGYPGALSAMTIGPGQGTWGNVDYKSSIRVWATGSIFGIANALGGNYPTAAAAAPAASFKAAAASAAAPETSDEHGGSADAPAGSADNADSTSGASTKPDTSTKAGDSDGDSTAGSTAKRTGTGHGKPHRAARSGAKSGNAA